MDRGWVKLWRKSSDGGMMRNSELWTFWTWCLIKASHKEKTLFVGNQQVPLNKGEFVFGRRQAAQELNLSERKIRTCLKSLKSTSNLTIKTTNKFSIISIINWEHYQTEERPNDQQNDQLSDQQVTSKRPASDQQVTTNKNERIKELKEIYKWLDLELWEDFRKHRIKLKSPLTNRAEKIILDKLEAFSKNNGNKPNLLIEKSIERGWKGIFLPDNQEEKKHQKPLTREDVENGTLEKNPAAIG